MLSFKDRTFCTYFANCKHWKTCPSALADNVNKSAQEWWNRFNKTDNAGDPPICIYAEQPDCFESKTT